MTSIGIRQAASLAKLMERNHAHNATPEKMMIHGVEATVVVLDHVDRDEVRWQSVHVLDYVTDTSVCIGNVQR